eukprot:scaffold105892_cov17-Tisochrysis_lutea.AAC.2
MSQKWRAEEWRCYKPTYSLLHNLQFSGPSDEVMTKLYALQDATKKDDLMESRTTFVSLVEALEGLIFEATDPGATRRKHVVHTS